MQVRLTESNLQHSVLLLVELLMIKIWDKPFSKKYSLVIRRTAHIQTLLKTDYQGKSF